MHVRVWAVFTLLVSIQGFRETLAGVVTDNDPIPDWKKDAMRKCRSVEPSGCSGSLTYIFDIHMGECVATNFGNCKKNGDTPNNFKTYEECKATCGNLPHCPEAIMAQANPPDGCRYEKVREADYPPNHPNLAFCPYPKLICDYADRKTGQPAVSDFTCPTSNILEEKKFTISCEFLLDSLYDLELDLDNGVQGGNNKITKNRPEIRRSRRSATDLNRSKRGTSHVQRLMQIAQESGKTFTEVALESYNQRVTSKLSPPKQQPAQNDFPPFYPENPRITQDEENARKRVCSALLTLPGVKRRCCSMIDLICPDFSSAYKKTKKIVTPVVVGTGGGVRVPDNTAGGKPQTKPKPEPSPTQPNVNPDDLAPPPGKPPPPVVSNGLMEFFKKILGGISIGGRG